MFDFLCITLPGETVSAYDRDAQAGVRSGGVLAGSMAAPGCVEQPSPGVP